MGLFKNRKKAYVDKEINDKPKVKDAEMGVEELSFMGKGSDDDEPIEGVGEVEEDA